MSGPAIIVPDHVTVSFALHLARLHNGVLQTNGQGNCIAPRLLPGYGRIAGGGERAATIDERRAGFRPPREAA
jgi:hypothetical protein